VFLDGSSDSGKGPNSTFLSPLSLHLACPSSRCPVSAPDFTAFHCPFGLVFTFRSHYLFAIGLGKYLAFPGGSWRIGAGSIRRYSGLSAFSTHCLTYGISTLFHDVFERLRLVSVCRQHILPHHIDLLRGLQFGLSTFQSPLFSGSRLFSFPALTRMFCFRAFPLTE